MENKILGTKLLLNGYVYSRSKRQKGRAYWDCLRLRYRECTARAVTSDCEPVAVYREGEHTHPPDREACQAEEITYRIKRRAEEHPEEPPARILRRELPTTSDEVLVHLPERESMKRSMRRRRGALQNLPPNPRNLAELQDIPDIFTKTSVGDPFLCDNWRQGDKRVIVFTTRKNLELLSRSAVWFVDGTFKVSPSIFTQVFTILGTVKRYGGDSDSEDESASEVALPFVYALLSTKEGVQYEQVFRAIDSSAKTYNIHNLKPQRVVSDFEIAIMNVCTRILESPVSGCLFHLRQAVHRRLQSEGLAAAYNDSGNRNIKLYTLMITAVAFVPVADVSDTLAMMEQVMPEDLKSLFKYFDETFGRGKHGRLGRKIPPRYHPSTWNQYEAALTGSHMTNNLSEGWHTRFHVVVGRDHPDLYALLRELQREQADTEIAVAELSLGRRVKAAPRKKWVEHHKRIRGIVLNYETYKNRGEVLEYIRLIGCNVSY